MSFSDEEVERYARHLVLREVGGPGQQALKAARVLIVGAGGLGAPASLYLAAAGVGRIGLVDADTVSVIGYAPLIVSVLAVLFATPVPPRLGAMTAPFQAALVMDPA